MSAEALANEETSVLGETLCPPCETSEPCARNRKTRAEPVTHHVLHVRDIRHVPAFGPKPASDLPYHDFVANLSRIDQPSKLKLYTSTAKVSRYVASSAFSGALVWLAVAQFGLAGLVPGGIMPWILAAGISALLALALAPFVVLDPKDLRDRLRRSAAAMAIGHTIVSIFLGALFLANPINLFFGTIASALIGAAAGALSGLISWKWGEGKR